MQRSEPQSLHVHCLAASQARERTSRRFIALGGRGGVLLAEAGACLEGSCRASQDGLTALEMASKRRPFVAPYSWGLNSMLRRSKVTSLHSCAKASSKADNQTLRGCLASPQALLARPPCRRLHPLPLLPPLPLLAAGW